MAKTTATPKTLRALVEAQGYRCVFTGQELTPETASLDHIVPVSEGGSHTIDNLCVVHFRVNAAKSTLNADEFIDLCRMVTEHNRDGFKPPKIGADDGQEADRVLPGL